MDAMVKTGNDRLCAKFGNVLIASSYILFVPSRKAIWLFYEQFRPEFVPVLHHL